MSSHMDGKVATKLFDGLWSGQEVTMEYINSVYHGSLQATREELYEACRGRLKMTIFSDIRHQGAYP